MDRTAAVRQSERIEGGSPGQRAASDCGLEPQQVSSPPSDELQPQRRTALILGVALQNVERMHAAAAAAAVTGQHAGIELRAAVHGHKHPSPSTARVAGMQRSGSVGV